jgi:hypothetical protein
MMRSIPFRRHQRERALAHAAHVFRQVWGDFALTKRAYKYADNLCKCSCDMCRPGSSGRQVLRADATARFQLNELKKGY